MAIRSVVLRTGSAITIRKNEMNLVVGGRRQMEGEITLSMMDTGNLVLGTVRTENG